MTIPSILGLAEVLTGTSRRRKRFIQSYPFPNSVYAALRELHPGLCATDHSSVVELLREWFLLCHAARGKFLAMPSQIVDDAWHAFILDTRSYAHFCHKAFGRFLHHTPAEAMKTPTTGSHGLRRTWRAALAHEGQHVMRPTRLPRLFAVDDRLNVKNGFRYRLDCSRSNSGGAYCAMELGGAGCGAGGCGSDGDVGGRSEGGSGWFDFGLGGGSEAGCGGGCGGD
jgi:hypothetical protein